MKLYRYMGKTEFNKMSCGCDIVGKSSFNARTESTGVCFLAESVKCKGEEITCFLSPENALDFLSGIVSEDFLVEFETEEALRESCGVYANIVDCASFDSTMLVTEYCLPQYNRDNVCPLRYAIPNRCGRFEWYNFN